MTIPGLVDDTQSRSVRNKIILLIGAALIVRLIWALLVPVEPYSDAEAYNKFAFTLANYGVFGFTQDQPLAFWPPGTSLIYAASYKLLGFHSSSVVAANLLLSLALLIVSARIAFRLYGANVAVSTVALIAFWPTLIMYTTITASELPYLLFTVAAFDAWTSDTRSWWVKAGIAGLFLGLACLVRPSALILPLLLAMCEFVRLGRTTITAIQQTKILVVSTLVMLLVVSPWTLRNYELFGEVVLVSTNGGVTLWMGNHPGSNGSFADMPEHIKRLPEVERAQILGEQAIQYIIDNPGVFLIGAIRKMVLLYGNESVGAGWNGGIISKYGSTTQLMMKRVTAISWMLIFGLSLVGLATLISRVGFWSSLLSPVVAMIVFHSAIHAVVVAQERYHLAFAVQIAILSAIGIQYLINVAKQRDILNLKH